MRCKGRSQKKKTVYLVTCAQIQGIPTPLPLLVTCSIVTNVSVFRTLPPLCNRDGSTMNLKIQENKI